MRSRATDGEMRSSASENSHISPATIVPPARGHDSGPHLSSVLQKDQENTSIHANMGGIWAIPDESIA
jgi:hypothetical protein